MEGRAADAEELKKALQAQKAAQPTPPNTFTINGRTFHHIKNTHTFNMEGGKRPLDIEQIFQLIYPKEFHSIKIVLDTPIILTDMSPACRRRACKMIEHHMYPQLSLPFIDDILPLIDKLFMTKTNESTAFISTYSAALAATGGDAAQALALTVYFGNTNLKSAQTDRVALYKLYTDDAGLHLDIDYPHTLEDRISHAVSVMAVMANYNLEMGFPVNTDSLVSKGFRLISSYCGYNISYTKDFFMEMQHLLNQYAQQLRHGNFAIDIDARLPYNLIEPEQRFIAWDKIIIEDNFLQSKRGKYFLNIFLYKVKDLQRGLPIHEREFLRYMGKDSLVTATKHHVVKKVDPLHYIILWPNEYAELAGFPKITRKPVDREKIRKNKIIY